MRVSSYSSYPSYSSVPPASSVSPASPAAAQTAPVRPGAFESRSLQAHPAQGSPAFLPFSPQAFAEAQRRVVPVFLLIGDPCSAFSDPALALHLRERTVPVRLLPGERPDAELLCQRAGALFSGEGALPLCALMTHDAIPFLAAPLPPPGYSLDPARMHVWLTHADRRFAQNPAACSRQAAEVIRSFRAEHPKKAYAPQDARHDLIRALLATQDKINGGFGRTKAPFVCALRAVQRAAARGNRAAHSASAAALDAMLSSALHDPLDGLFFRSTLTENWRAFVPEKPLAVNALLAIILLESGRRSEAVRLLAALTDAFSLQGGGLSPLIHAPQEAYAFSAEQVCAALGSENGLRACRLLSLLRQRTRPSPVPPPSRFSPVPSRRAEDAADSPALCPILPDTLVPEDAAFLRRMYPGLRRVRAARSPQQPAPYVLTTDCALCAAVLAHAGLRLAEPRFTQAAQRAVSFLIAQPSMAAVPVPLPAALLPASAAMQQPVCGASAALALAQLVLGQGNGMEAYTYSGLRLLGAALHAFVRPDGLVMHTPGGGADFFPRVPAIYDSELPSPAALLIHALHLAHTLRPDMHYDDAIAAIWSAAAPAARAQPIACASLIDAINP